VIMTVAVIYRAYATFVEVAISLECEQHGGRAKIFLSFQFDSDK
jgi:hypothetical protein